MGGVAAGFTAGAERTSSGVGGVFGTSLGGIVLAFIGDRFDGVVNGGGEGISALVLAL